MRRRLITLCPGVPIPTNQGKRAQIYADLARRRRYALTLGKLRRAEWLGVVWVVGAQLAYVFFLAARPQEI